MPSVRAIILIALALCSCALQPQPKPFARGEEVPAYDACRELRERTGDSRAC